MAVYTIGMAAYERIGISKAYPRLIVLLRDRRAYVRERAAFAFANATKVHTDISSAVPGLIRLLKDRDNNVKVEALRALKGAGLWGANISKAVPRMVRLVRSDDVDVKAGAILALGEALTEKNTDRIVNALVDVKLAKHEDWKVRRNLAMSFYSIADHGWASDWDSILNSLAWLTDDKAIEVRKNAARSIGRVLGNRRVDAPDFYYDKFFKLLKDNSQEVRIAALHNTRGVIENHYAPDDIIETLMKFIKKPKGRRPLKDDIVSSALRALGATGYSHDISIAIPRLIELVGEGEYYAREVLKDSISYYVRAGKEEKIITPLIEGFKKGNMKTKMGILDVFEHYTIFLYGGEGKMNILKSALADIEKTEKNPDVLEAVKRTLESIKRF